MRGKRPIGALSFLIISGFMLAAVSGCADIWNLLGVHSTCQIAYANGTKSARGTASRDVAIPALSSYKIKLVTVYLFQDRDANNENVGFTPIIYLNPQCNNDIGHSAIYPWTGILNVVSDYFELAQPAAAVNAELNAVSYEVTPGTYKGIQIDYSGGPRGGESWPDGLYNASFEVDGYTREYRTRGGVTAYFFDQPITIGIGQSATVTLSYDLSSCVSSSSNDPYAISFDYLGATLYFVDPELHPSVEVK